MKRFLLSLLLGQLAILLSPTPSVQAQGGGMLLKTFDLKAGKLLLDPAHPRLYALLPNDNSLAILDTNANTVVTTLYVGSQPIDLDISPDGTRLYVLNGGSTVAGIGVVDLTSLTLVSSLPTPAPGLAIAAGLGNRLYVQVQENSPPSNESVIMQMDATSGALQGTFPDSDGFVGGILVISPDKTTLFAAGSELQSFDVSTATPSLLQSAADPGSDLAISPDGRYLIGVSDNYTTSLISSSDLSIIGTFATGRFPDIATFSADGSLLYQVRDDSASNGVGATLEVFSTQTFALLDSFDLPYDGSGYPPSYNGLAVTSPNGYLYVASNSDPYGMTIANLTLVSTRSAPFFNGSVPLSDGFYFLQFPNGNFFGYYNFNDSPYLFHIDLQFEYPIDALDGSGGIYFYDFASETFFYTSPTLFPYLYDFSLSSFLYYFPNTRLTGHYTAYPRYFYDFATGQIISK